ncbi:UDP-N-acetylglucosamine 2-epimerase [Curvivirga aplysinae]|uniref:UDP-N-acetylglucosamine 2-epimerase n=1 Tax=Curvivirga aplysinae TaxID=2529852 RepID=UPI0012BD1305|nr:UDP-N-acetylglucosamine 2-epimerase [Curvivirga aplysinae]MTI11389.1 UDP-N-acetylglucosamine 2-epimerase (hydrolyzing) [Curvivirga aplysinae]
MTKVAIFTSGRAEYGLLTPLIDELKEHPEFEVGLFVTGMHLSHEFGHSVNQIEANSHVIWERIEGLLSGDSESAICKSLALTTLGMSEALQRHQPDILFLLGDRYELLAAAQAATIHRIPIGHIHGGETTEGAFDEAIRHAITKMSHLHFTSTDIYRQRVIQMGESPQKVFNVGAMGLDNITKLNPLSRQQLSEDLKLDFDKKTFLITYHPVTLEDKTPKWAVMELLDALSELNESNFIFTHPNSDPNSREILPLVRDFVESHAPNAILVENLGMLRYLSVLKIAAAVIGNSSSGIIEAPLLNTATINIGSRQRGRIAGNSIIQCDDDQDEILNAIRESQSKSFQRNMLSFKNPYGYGNASSQIVDILSKIKLDKILIKKFNDLDNIRI